MEFLRMDIILAACISAFLAVLGKIVWDWFQSGRVTDQYIKKTDLNFDKELYMKKTDCAALRQSCCVQELKRDFAKFKESDSRHEATADSRIKVLEDKVKESQLDSKEIKGDISDIKEKLTQLLTIFEERWGNEHK